MKISPLRSFQKLMKQKSTFLFFLFASLAFVVLAGVSCEIRDTDTDESSDSEEITEADDDIDLDEFCSSGGSSTTTPH